jgi:predicted Zn-dependent protease
MIEKLLKALFLKGMLLLFLILWLSSCAVNPVTGKHELMLLSESDEIKLGRETDLEVIQKYGVYEDERLNSYLNDICQRLKVVSHRPQLAYNVKIVDSPVVNAFAVPGGYIYFSRGILAAINSEAELASVMGHEMGHITARHSAQQYSKAQIAQIGLGIGSIFIDSPILTSLGQLGVGLLFLRFSRDNERQADDLGVEYASKAGYDAIHMAQFFEILERMNPGSDRSGLPGWFSTHPSPEDRIQRVRQRSKEWKERLGLKELRVGREEYLRRIDGLVYGEDPRQGYVSENVFYHPQLRFQFPVPTNWKLNNTPSQVQIVNKDGDGIILFGITKAISSREVARKFISETKANLLSSEAVIVNRFPSQRIISDIQTQKGVLRVLSYFIEKDNKVFIFHGVSPNNRFQHYVYLFDNTMRNFKELIDSKRINVRPDRIRIISANRSDSIENILLSVGVKNDELKGLILLNGATPKQFISIGTLIKVIEKGTTISNP